MNVGLIIAGGVGNRMKQEIPKQFISVDDKPIIIYTLEAFQKHPEIDAIYVVCLENWENILEAYCKQNKITKLKKIVTGGNTGMHSIRNGLFAINDDYSSKEDTIVLIHDAIRPMLSQDIISNNIATCKKYGNAITVVPCNEAMLKTDDKISSTELYDRDKLMRTQTPQTFNLKDIINVHEEAIKKNIENSVASCTLYTELGHKVYFCEGSLLNIKITTPDDLIIFKSLLKTEKR